MDEWLSWARCRRERRRDIGDKTRDTVSHSIFKHCPKATLHIDQQETNLRQSFGYFAEGMNEEYEEIY